MPADQTDTEPTTAPIIPPRPGQFCEPHFSWLCQAGQGKCQRREKPAEPTTEPGTP